MVWTAGTIQSTLWIVWLKAVCSSHQQSVSIDFIDWFLG
jgi:hypothetical protein